MSNPANTRSVIVERVMPFAPERIWRAVTQGALIEEWLMQNDFQPVVGHRFQLRMPPMAKWNGVTDCEVLIVEAQQCLCYTWNASGEEADAGLKTVVTWTLENVDGGTLLRMEQSGFREHETINYKGATYGWQKFIGELERVVAGLEQA
jgi:uncharacterized protein YndB with AHSA1/START domain